MLQEGNNDKTRGGVAIATIPDNQEASPSSRFLIRIPRTLNPKELLSLKSITNRKIQKKFEETTTLTNPPPQPTIDCCTLPPIRGQSSSLKDFNNLSKDLAIDNSGTVITCNNYSKQGIINVPPPSLPLSSPLSLSPPLAPPPLPPFGILKSSPLLPPGHIPKKEGASKPNKDGGIAVEFAPYSTDKNDGFKDVWLGCVEYEPFQVPFSLGKAIINALVEVRIPIKAFDEDKNMALRKGLIWGGTDQVYTDDSDVVCILRHVGFVPTKNFTHFKAEFRITPRQKEYLAVEGVNGFKSRAWKSHYGLSLRFLKVKGCGFSAHHKQRPNKLSSLSSSAQCTIRFSSTFRSPMLNYNDLLLRPEAIKSRLDKGDHLYLAGQTNWYLLFCSTTNGEYTIKEYNDSKPSPPPLKWREVSWSQNGLTINGNFLAIDGYYWASRGSSHFNV